MNIKVAAFTVSEKSSNTPTTCGRIIETACVATVQLIYFPVEERATTALNIEFLAVLRHTNNKEADQPAVAQAGLRLCCSHATMPGFLTASTMFEIV